ncbi:MAG: hypothetical protein ABEN55_03180, partial [Bradymonadaceae bacterium]
YVRTFAAVTVAAIAVVWASPARGGEPATKLTIQADEVRNYKIPKKFSLSGRVVESTSEGRTLIGNTSGKGKMSTCTVIVATGESAQAFPYKHSADGTRCVGVLPHPDGGFFVRGMAAGAKRGDVAGFTARIDAEGSERWLVHDTKTAESEDFKGSYQQPHSPLAYSPQSNYLLTFTTGKLTIGDIDEKTVTHASVIKGGEMRVPAKTIGGSGGFGVIGGVASLESTGDFLLYIYSPGSQGANFFTYDGRVNVDEFEPMGESWGDRFVRRMIYGPDSNVYLLWSDKPKGGGPTHVSVVDDQAAEVWSESYASTVILPAERKAPPADVGDVDVGSGSSNTKEVALGAPGSIWVGSEHVVILYAANAPYMRVIDAETGREVGVAPLAGATQYTPINILKGKEGRLKLLAVDQNMTRFHELSLSFEEGETPNVDAGSGGDAGPADVADGGSGSGGNGGGSESGCSTTDPARPVGLAGALWGIGVVGLLVGRRRT